MGALTVGDHVKARRDLTITMYGQLSGRPTVRRGKVGIVRAVHAGFWSRRCDVEFDDGLMTVMARSVNASDLRSAYTHGETSWQRRRDISVGVRLGLLALNLPLVFMLVKYLVAGGSLPELIGAVLVGGLDLVAGLLLSHPLLTLGAIAALVFLSRRRV